MRLNLDEKVSILHSVTLLSIYIMASSKKKRGKQRKAAKNQGLDAACCAATIIRANDKSMLSNFTPQVTHKFIEYIRKGEDNCTKVFVYHDISNWYSGYNDIVPIALNFLKRCEHETFARVMADVGGRPAHSFRLGDNSCEGRFIRTKL